MTDEALRKAFVARLKRAMEEHNYNQSDIARITGVSQQTVSDWLTLKKYPRMKKVGILAAHFGIDPIEFYGDNKKEPTIQDSRLQEMINDFNSLSPEDQQVVLVLVSSLSKKAKSP